MAKIVEKYGAKKFLVVIGDNENKMQAALALLKQKYKHLDPMGCISHWLNLLSKDILAAESTKEVVSNMLTIAKTIKRSHHLSAETKASM